MSEAGEWKNEARERKEGCRYVMTVKHICGIIGDEPSDGWKETLEECEEMCRYMLAAPRLEGRGFCAHWGFLSFFGSPSRARHHYSVPAASFGRCMAHRLLDSPYTNFIFL